MVTRSGKGDSKWVKIGRERKGEQDIIDDINVLFTLFS